MTSTVRAQPASNREAAQLTDLHVGEELGRGAFTMVHRARRADQWYALKRPLADPADYPDILAAFHREAALLACVDDASVVRVHAAGVLDGVPALVLEHVAGGSLADRLASGAALDAEQSVRLATEIAHGLAAAHRLGLVHRDVKPGNVMLTEDGHAKLIDFGLARLDAAAPAKADSEEAVGTFLYASPEQAGMLKRPVDGRSDLYSLGVLLFECLTGQLPFEADDVGELLRLHLTAPVPDLAQLRPGVDPAVVAVVSRLLAKDPDDRYPDAAAVVADLRHCPGGATPPPVTADWPICGRDAELDQLNGRWERARAGHGSVAVVHGGAGAGRTRLAEHAARRAAQDGVPVLWATCLPGEATPLTVVRQALDGWLAHVRRLPAAERAEAERHLREAAATAGPALVARLSGALDALLDGAAGAGSGGDEHVFAAGATFLGDLAVRSGGLLVAVDDAHLMDSGSRQLLAQLAPELAGLPALVVVTEVDDADDRLDWSAGQPLEVRCTALAPAAVAQLIASRLPGAQTPTTLVEHIAARTDGTPLAVVGHLLRLLDAGLLSPLWGSWRLDTAGADALPAVAGLRNLLASRLAGLAAEDREALAVAAAAGLRLRPELLTAVGDADAMVRALAAGVDRRIVEPRPDGWYAFVHPELREALLETVPEESQRLLHAALAEAYEQLAPELRDEAHVYTVARHYQLAGPAAPDAARRRSAADAGMRALADQAPAEAIDYLTDAVAGDPAPDAALLHALAQAYLRAARFAEAAEVLDRALAGERDATRRARLLTTQIELRHTLWDDERALGSARAALAALGRPLPGRGLLLLLSTLAIALAGGLVRRTRVGFGTARGQRRENLTTMTAVLDAGGYAAAIGLRLREAAIFALRAMYAVNRLGPSPEYVRVYALIGYVCAIVRLHGTGERCFKQAGQVATGLADPALQAYVEWIRGCALLFGGYDDGSAWERTLTRNARWYQPAQMLPGHAVMGMRLLLRGYLAESRREYDRGIARLADPAQAHGMSIGMLGVMIPAYQGKSADAAAELENMRATFPDGVGTRVQRANILTAAACALLEQGEHGEPFEAVLRDFHALGLRGGDLMAQHRWFFVYQARGRLLQLRYAPDEEQPRRLAEARQAIRQLRKVAATPLLRVVHLTALAGLHQLTGDHRRAIRLADQAEQVTRALDAPLVQYEVYRIRARAMRAMNMPHEADRQARFALSLAAFHGWEHRRRQTRTEFGVDETTGTHRRTVAAAGGSDRNRRLEAMQQVGAAAASILDPRQLAQVALDEMLRILGAERALFFLLDDAGEPVPYVGRDTAGDLNETTEYGATLVRRVAETGEAVVITGTEQGAALGSRSAVVHGLRSILVAPVQFKGKPIGVAYLDSRLARGVFTDDDVAVLTAMTSHVAVSLETAKAAQLHLAVQAARQQQALAEMLRASLAELSAILDPAELLHRLCRTLGEQAGATAGALLSAPDDAAVTVLEALGQTPSELVGSTLAATELAGLDAGEDASPVLLDGAALPALRDRLLGGAPTVLAVALRSRDTEVGTLLLGGPALTDTNRQVVAALTSQGMTAYDNARLFTQVQALATTDELTGQHNRRHFFVLADALVQAAGRNGRPLAAAMLDIDKFKAINDTYGHGVGDDVIRTVAARVRATLRHSDVLGRYGGEEFGVILPDHDGREEEIAERMRQAVAAEPVATRSGPVPVTISVGLSRLQPGDAAPDHVLARADHALYRAKEAGRNRVMVG